MFLCGRQVTKTLDNCKFISCAAGVVHQTDGKGGAIAFGGGHQGTKSGSDNSPVSHTPHGKLTIQGNTLFYKCTSSDNGGGIYLTISGEIEMKDTTIEDCDAFGGQGVSGFVSLPNEEGLGGGLHVTAAGMLRMLDGCIIRKNRARFGGGGIGCKNGLLEMSASSTGISIEANTVQEHLENGGGYGGGIYLSTAFNDLSFFGKFGGIVWTSADDLFGPGKLNVDDGMSGSTQRRITIKDNWAKQWGGGLFVGVPAAINADCEVEVNCLFDMNICATTGANSPLYYPNEVVSYEQDGKVNMKTSHINGPASGIGLYKKNSDGYIWGAVTFGLGIGKTFQDDD